MRTRLVAIGKSQGICIPAPLLKRTGLHGEVEISAEHDSLVIRPVRSIRAGWAQAFRAMAKRGDDALVDEAGVPSPSSWDEEEWEW